MEPLFELKPYTVKTDHEENKSNFQTPPDICRYMVELLPTGTRKILEPTAGDGNIINALNYRKNCIVTAPEDFFIMKAERFDAVVMNPPFSAKYCNIENAPSGIGRLGMRVGYHILTECMKMAPVIIALMPWFTISDSDVRLRFLKKYGLRSITALPRKTFQYARIQTVVLELNEGYRGKTEFKVFDLL